ncbi:MAG: enoyl-CoA hydratase/isomerase family protein [Candidatus Heimdallarchaeaceae archaeon]
MAENEKCILLEKIGLNRDIALITLNRQQALNSLNAEMLCRLEEIFLSLKDDSDCEVIIISAKGKSWCAGVDLKWMASMEKNVDEVIKKGQEVFATIETHPCPVIAAINGYALGGGMELALACDIRIAAETALFGQPEVTIGLAPGWGATYRLPKVVGLGIAKELILTGRKFSAEEAYRINLVSAIYPLEDLDKKALELAETIALNAPIAVKEAKKAINSGLHVSVEGGYRAELKGASVCFETEDIREGIEAILEKRKPAFKGK